MPQEQVKAFRERAIIALDDFGISAAANANILDLVASGKADRVAIMTHGTMGEDEISTLLRSGVRLDIHLDKDDEIDGDRELTGTFFGRIFSFVSDYASGKYRPKTVRKTWEKQIEAFRSRFHRNPDGLNSHQHVHFFPPFSTVIFELADQYGVGYVRLGKKRSGMRTPVSFVLDFLRLFDRKRFSGRDITSSDRLVSADWASDLSVEAFLKTMPENERTELIFHPEREEEFTFLSKI